MVTIFLKKIQQPLIYTKDSTLSKKIAAFTSSNCIPANPFVS